MNDGIVFKLTIADFESILGRELSMEECSTAYHDFNIDDWSEHVECFFDIHGIK